MNPAQQLANRSVLTIYRDCTKLIHRMVPEPNNVKAAQLLLRRQFQKHRQQFDNDKIHSLKLNAVKGISNYLIYKVQRDHKLLNKKPVNIMEEHDEDDQIVEMVDQDNAQLTNTHSQAAIQNPKQL